MQLPSSPSSSVLLFILFISRDTKAIFQLHLLTALPFLVFAFLVAVAYYFVVVAVLAIVLLSLFGIYDFLVYWNYKTKTDKRKYERTTVVGNKQTYQRTHQRNAKQIANWKIYEIPADTEIYPLYTDKKSMLLLKSMFLVLWPEYISFSNNHIFYLC